MCIRDSVQAGRTGPIPRQLQNRHFDGEDALVKGQNYKYAHSYANHWVQQQYLSLIHISQGSQSIMSGQLFQRSGSAS